MAETVTTPQANAAPQDVLHQFFRAMNDWERTAWERESDWVQRKRQGQTVGDLDEIRKSYQAQLQEIFAQFCTPKKRSRSLISKKPEYDPDGEHLMEVVPVSARKVVIRTQQTTASLNTKCEYVLMKKGDRWLVDSKRDIYADGTSSSVPL